MKGYAYAMAAALARSHPEIAAEVLEDQDPESSVGFLDSLEPMVAASVLSHSSPHSAAHFIRYWEPQSITQVLAVLDRDALLAIVRAMSAVERDKILPQLPKPLGDFLRAARAYLPGSVGAWMNTEILTFQVGAPVERVLRQIRTYPFQKGLREFYVVDKRGRLEGKVDIYALLSADSSAAVETMMSNVRYRVSSASTLASVSVQSLWFSVESVPVLDSHDRLVGTLSHLDLRHALSTASDTGVPHESLFSDLISAYGDAVRGFAATAFQLKLENTPVSERAE